MSDTAVSENRVGTEYGLDNFRAMSSLYRANKSIVDAASKFDGLDDAIVALTDTWTALEKAYSEGSGYTPPHRDGWEGLNACQISAGVMGRRASIGGIRKALRDFSA